MSTHQHATIEDTIYLFFGANDTSGSGGDGATPVYDVRLAGAAASAIPVLSGAATLLTHANFPAGAHEVAIAATVANGFASNATYGVFCTLLVDSQNPTGFVGSFTLTPLATASQVNNIGSGATGGTHVEATYDNTTQDTIDAAAAVDKGGGLVGIPVTGHAFVAGREVTIAGTVNYNGAFEVISQTANEVVITDTFVSETFGGAETIVSSIKGEIFVGTITGGTFANVDAANGSTHDMNDVTDIIKIAYGYNIGGSRQGTEVAIFANVDGNTDEIRVKAWDFVGNALDDRGVLEGSGGSSFVPLDLALLSKHTGTAAGELGDVFIFFDTDSTTPSSLSVDECLLTAVGTSLLIGYPNGFEIVSTGTSGTEYGVNGTAGNPCPYADAVVMNAANPLNLFSIHNGETVTLGADSDGISLIGEAWTLVLGGTTAGTFIRGANMSGTSTGAGYILDTCTVGATTMAPGTHRNCIYTDATTGFTMGSPGTYFINDPRSGVAGNTAPVFTWDGSGTSKGNFRAISTGVKFEAMAAGDIATVEGLGQFVEGTCPGGAVTLRGNLTLSGISNIAITDEARFDTLQINAEVDTALADYDGPTNAEMEARTISSAAAINLETVFDGVEGFAIAYMGPRGPGVYYDDAAANTNTVDGTDGTWNNHVSTPTAVKTLTDSLGLKRVYIVNNSSFTPPAAMEDYEFIAIGEMTANTFVYGSQDVDRTVFYNMLLTGAQGGTGRCQAIDCCLSVITGMEITALGCLLADAGSLTLRNDCAFDRWWSAVAGGGSPILNINSVANVNAYLRHGSGGIQIDNAVATTVMSIETDGQVTVGATSTSLTAHIRGNCSVTDNGTTTNLTEDAAISRTGIRSAVGLATANLDTQLADIPTTAEFEARTLLAASYFDPTADAVANVTLVGTLTTYTGNTPQTGDNFARIGVAGAGLTNINLPNQTMDIVGSITGNLSGSVGSVTGAVGSVTADVTTDAASRTASKADVSALALEATVDTVKTDTAAILLDTGTVGVVVAAASKAGYSLVATGLNLVLVDGRTLPNAMEIIAAGVIGKISGAGTGTEVFVGLDLSTVRATVVVDGSGNRTGVTYV